MTRAAELLGLGDRELVALVGGGGKSTLLFRLGDELAAAGKRVVLTTTTKMGRYQISDLDNVCWSSDTQCAEAALSKPGPVMLLTDGDDHKVTGPPPEVVDQLYASSTADYIVVEADGSHGRPLKAPAAHEPVVPRAATTVVIMVGIDAVGQRVDRAVHRVEVAYRFAGLDKGHLLTTEDCSEILSHPDGALRVCPRTSRVIVAVTKASSETDRASAAAIARQLENHPRIAACVLLDG